MHTEPHTHIHSHEHTHSHDQPHPTPDDVHNPHRPDLGYMLSPTFLLTLQVNGQTVAVPDGDAFALTIQVKSSGQRRELTLRGWVAADGRIHVQGSNGPTMQFNP